MAQQTILTNKINKLSFERRVCATHILLFTRPRTPLHKLRDFYPSTEPRSSFLFVIVFDWIDVRCGCACIMRRYRAMYGALTSSFRPITTGNGHAAERTHCCTSYSYLVRKRNGSRRYVSDFIHHECDRALVHVYHQRCQSIGTLLRIGKINIETFSSSSRRAYGGQ